MQRVQRLEKMSTPQLHLLASSGFAGYALLDSGVGRKLERFGTIVVDRPEAQALWQPRLPKAEWAKAHAVFSASGEDDEKGKWRVDKPVPESWPVPIDLGGDVSATMLCRLAGLWHLGLFPEQLPHWQWMVERVTDTAAPAVADGVSPSPLTGEGGGGAPHRLSGTPPSLTLPRKGGGNTSAPRVLNLFGYTGAASLLAAAAGAQVTHVDASKKAVSWARENQAASNLADAPIRWIVDDAAKFVAREIRRGRQYDVILVDPPKFGRGPDGEVWDLFQHLPAHLRDCAGLLAPGRSHMVLTVYAIRASALAFGQVLEEALGGRPGSLEIGELAIRETEAGVPTPLRGRAREGGTAEQQPSGFPPPPPPPRKGEGGNARLLPTSLYVRWSGR